MAESQQTGKVIPPERTSTRKRKAVNYDDAVDRTEAIAKTPTPAPAPSTGTKRKASTVASKEVSKSKAPKLPAFPNLQAADAADDDTIVVASRRSIAPSVISNDAQNSSGPGAAVANDTDNSSDLSDVDDDVLQNDPFTDPVTAEANSNPSPSKPKAKSSTPKKAAAATPATEERAATEEKAAPESKKSTASTKSEKQSRILKLKAPGINDVAPSKTSNPVATKTPTKTPTKRKETASKAITAPAAGIKRKRTTYKSAETVTDESEDEPEVEQVVSEYDDEDDEPARKKAKPSPKSKTTPAKSKTSSPAKSKATKSTKSPQTPKNKSRGSAAGLLTPPDSTQTTARSSPPPISLAHVDPAILALSRQLTLRQPLESKLEPAGSPKVWADSRQALCETVPYFKKPQGGCHQNDQHVYSFLYDGVGHCREYMDGNIIIARAGGGMEWDDSVGHMVQKKDHLMTEAQFIAVNMDILLQNPLIVIVGDKNTCSPIKLPHKYCVLGWYKPVAVWAEKTAGKGKKEWTTIKYRFERLNEVETAWHAPKDPLAIADKLPLESHQCENCKQIFPQIYLAGWICLNPDCGDFWRLDDENAPTGILDYNPAFLQARTTWENEAEPFSVVPKLPEIGRNVGDHLTYINTRGMCCPDCGRCNSRYLFSGWRCDNPTCDWTLTPETEPVLPSQLHSPWDSVGDGPSLGRNKHEKSVNVKVSYTHGFKVFTYTFTGVKGSLVHAVANDKINKEVGGPNDMLADMQTKDIGLERRRFGIEKLSGTKEEKAQKAAAKNAADQDEEPNTANKPEPEAGDFMTAYSMNYGMPYKFVASGASQPFENAPQAVRSTRSRLNWAAKTFLTSRADEAAEPVAFNEELIFAYMEGQKIEYHDDGEEGLGPCIATLSLGGKAKMHLRTKTKHYVGCSKSGVFTPERPIPNGHGGPETDVARLEAWEELQLLSGPARARRAREIPKELGLYEKRGKKAPDLVTLSLGHGDIVLMDGYDVQKYLEHKVVPEGYLRFALTCRTVLEGHLSEEEKPGYVVGEDEEGYDGSGLL